MRTWSLWIVGTMIVTSGCPTPAPTDGDTDTDASVTTDDKDDEDDNNDDEDEDNNDDEDTGELPPLESDPFDLDASVTAFAEAYCAHREACEPVFAEYLPETREECEAAAAESYTAYWGAIEALIDEELVGFSQDAFDACIDAYTDAAADCVTGLDPLACTDLFAGVTKKDDACSASEECAPGLWCDADAVGGCGSCQPLAAAEEDCTGAPCEPGYVCAQTGATTYACAPLGAELGDSCGSLQDGFCRGQLQCVGSGTTFECVEPATLEDDCVTDGTAADCNILVGEVCGEDDVCIPVTYAGLDAPCGDVDLSALCTADLYCATATDSCTAEREVGATCNANLPCAEGTYCKPNRPGAANGKCAEFVAAGETCTTSSECEGLLYCIGSECTDLEFDATCE